eukprot:scaffold14560_cov60-Phaeocystis_antarctica.AAC.8
MAPHVVALHPMSQRGVSGGLKGIRGGESGGVGGSCEGGGGEGGGGDGGGGDGEGGGGDGGLSGDGGGGVGGEGAEGGEGGGMSTTAKSTGSHCGGQAPPRAEGCDFELGGPTACAMIACPEPRERVVAGEARERERAGLQEGPHTLPTLGNTTLAACGAPTGMTVAEGGARGDTGSTLPGVSYTVCTAAKGLDQLMSSVCRTSTNWRCCRSTSSLSIAASSSAPAQLALGVVAASVSPQSRGRLASTITPPCVTLPSCALHCHAASGCGGGPLTNDTIEAPTTHGEATSTSAAEQSRASSAGANAGLGRDRLVQKRTEVRRGGIPKPQATGLDPLGLRGGHCARAPAWDACCAGRSAWLERAPQREPGSAWCRAGCSS